MAVVAYARVSAADQNLDAQIEMLEGHGFEKLFTDKATGTNTERAGLKDCLNYLREGDVLIVTRLDRLARNVLDLMTMVDDFTAKGIGLKILTQSIDTTTTAGRAFLQMLAVFAEFETNLRRDRQMEGLAKAKAAGKQIGRKPLTKETVADITRMRGEGASVRAIAKALSLSVGVVGKYTKNEQA